MTEYVGLDVSKEETSFCVVDEAGVVLARGKVASDPRSLFEAMREHTLCPERIVMETGTLSNWLARGLRALGLPVDVIDARQAHAVMKLQHNKTDANDAHLLAEIARTGFCRPVSVSSEAAQKHRILIKARRHLVCQRRATENAIRGFLSSLGLRFAKGSGKLAHRVRAALEERPDLGAIIVPLLASAEALKAQIKRLDGEIVAEVKVTPAARLLTTVPGVGPITALAFVLTLEDPKRFAKSRHVGPYLGLVPRRDQSGETDKHLRITKAGDRYLRWLLVSCAQYILGAHGPDSTLRTWGLARCAQGGRTGKKRAVVAVARKLAILLHRLWSTGEVYDPFYEAKPKPATD